MKVIGLTCNYLPAEEVNHFPGIFLMSDSSLLKDGKPFFVPSFSNEITLRPAAVIRIHRLGKNIAKKFANRYYDAVTVGFSLTAEDLKRELTGKGLPADLATSFDGSAILGDFVPVEEAGSEPDAMKISVECENEVIDSFSTENLNFDFDSIIEYISKYYTLKIGDIIYTGFSGKSFPVSIDKHYRCTLNGKPVLEFKTK